MRRRAETGAVAVEAALISVIMVPLFFFSVIFFGLWAYSSAQVSAAAKDGTRKAMLDPANTTVINAAVLARLDVESARVTTTVTCEYFDIINQAWANSACTNQDNMIPGRSRVTVTVSWRVDEVGTVSGLFPDFVPGPGVIPTVIASSTRDVVGLPR